MSQNYTPEHLHQKLISKYILNKPGYNKVLGIRNTKQDKHDIDVIRENHQFLWEEADALDTWEKQLAKRYYDKLYKEYAIVELKNYLKNDVSEMLDFFFQSIYKTGFLLFRLQCVGESKKK